MKTPVLLAIALLCASVNARNCMSTCRTQLLNAYEKDCSAWREELPRPDLYNHCQMGYVQGREAACEVYCDPHGAPDERKLDTLRMDACLELRGRPPSDRINACYEGFVAARARAQGVVTPSLKAEVDDTPKETEPAPTRRTVSVKRQAEAKNILEMAREEAHAAFHEAKSSDL
ncbi:hypothetical protein Poli38472_008819 [Pythium oligandrum]|uniref:Secreted protein n=1 Tax=Pythium oligandrum TaxID=41045 RepID=A0A8K1C499_PYTOL|nr:hypothetical protein Poli38472_008819 [Pythium oligandrum]|eukprot:TMW56171.1 hypothetical protein Poli38472_008819 [Pythium oligandrum]